MNPELLDILCCPETHQNLSVAPAALVEELNRLIAAGQAQGVHGGSIRDSIEGGLLRQDGRVLYPVRHSIPVLLISEAISVPTRV